MTHKHRMRLASSSYHDHMYLSDTLGNNCTYVLIYRLVLARDYDKYCLAQSKLSEVMVMVTTEVSMKKWVIPTPPQPPAPPPSLEASLCDHSNEGHNRSFHEEMSKTSKCVRKTLCPKLYA